ncbi:family 43 glycosylhydrolase [Prevotella communis]|uniref:family 43 glycosylhydrolase n=1 Tax=Prevotella communis TaxID=2913614 RepID=UPI001EDB5D36|nr:family 43 glycosylhydrolase [Prevotella communis]UKK62680.1 family 43 glycosylhydrolase [Prevotella communis]UKK65505.1 family 43 glycosylhydrolase [Prevotella communis]
MKNRLIVFAVALMLGLAGWAQSVKPLPSLHVEGKWLVDTYGNHVVLHGVMDTPSAYFNGGRWGWNYDANGAKNCVAYFEKLFTGLEKANCDVFRLHLDPAWTNSSSVTAAGFTSKEVVENGKTVTKYYDPIGQEVGGEANIMHFSAKRLSTYMKSVYVPIMKEAMNHGMYVVVRPPGVCPGEIRVDGYYQKYLMEVWDSVSKNETVRAFAGQISLELANEPVSVKNASGNNDKKALHDFFQPIVEKIRENGFTGIIWIPGSGWQANYADYKTYPITGDNIGYAVHDYDGWYGCADKNLSASDVPAATQRKITQFHNQVPVVDTNPVIITEIDWSPYKPGTDHVNEHGETVLSNYGTWATGRTSVWGTITKGVHDHYGNISMTLSGTACLIDIDKLLADGSVVPAFDGLEEACGKACMDWYAEYAKVNNPVADYQCDVPIADNGNGTYTNPVVRADIPDPDVIRVGDTYYMVSTTMVHFPGATILKSKDMVNWEYCANPLEKLLDDDRYNLRNGQNFYSKGMWACSMKYHDGKFYILINGNDSRAWLLTATDPEGKWTVKRLAHNYYDPGMLFDNGKVYIVCGINHLTMVELDENFNELRSKVVVVRDDAGLEGCHLYKHGDYYYIYATYGGWPSGQVAFRSTDPFGTYEEKMLVEKTINGQVNTIHQGALIEDTAGKWWTIMQQDLGALGRFPNLQPVTWVDGWPIVGNNGVPYQTYTKPAGTNEYPRQMTTTDVFRNFPLDMQWEWNHLPQANGYSLFERAGWLRLKATSTTNLLSQAQNTLTQRIYMRSDKPAIGTVRLDVTKLADGDRAGICIFQDPYAQIGVEKKNGEYKIYWRQDALDGAAASTKEQYASATVTDIVYLRASFNYNTSKTKFYYSLDNKTWSALGGETSMGFNLSVFVGARFGLFCYATSALGGGSADFDWFSTEEDFDEDALYQPFTRPLDESMFTATQLAPAATSMYLKIGALYAPRITATFKDKHTENVSSQVTYESSNPENVEIVNGQLRGLKQGSSVITASYTDILGNNLETSFTANGTYFPLGQDDVKVLKGSGTYTEKNHIFVPNKNGRIGWSYDTPIDISEFRYLVIKLISLTTATPNFGVIICPKISNVWYASELARNKVTVIDLQSARYTTAVKKNQPLDLTNIASISLTSDGTTATAKIYVSEVYLTNENPVGIDEVEVTPDSEMVNVYTLGGQLLQTGVNRSEAVKQLPAGVYVIGKKKVIIR